jgi:hypothetical protein
MLDLWVLIVGLKLVVLFVLSVELGFSQFRQPDQFVQGLVLER